MDVTHLLDRLAGVRANGDGAWIARCPSHEDRSPSLTVKALNDGRILMHCFAGCGTDDVLGAIGLGMTDLFPEPLSMHYPRTSLPFSAMDALACLQREAGVLMVLGSDIAASRLIAEADADRAAEAAGRIYAAMETIRA